MGAVTTASSTDLRESAETVLQQLAGPQARLREDQWSAIEALAVDRRRALVVQRTGWGKSAVYFIAAKLLRAAGLGATVIVSPLLALMRNQVAAADRAGVHAATINSSNVADWSDIHARVRGGDLDVLLVSPERLTNPDFRDEVLPALARDAGLVVVDVPRGGEHEVRWHPMDLVETGMTPDGLPTAVPEWGPRQRILGGRLPEPIVDLLALWREERTWSDPREQADLYLTMVEDGYEPGWLARPEPDHELPLWRRVVAELPGTVFEIQESA